MQEITQFLEWVYSNLTHEVDYSESQFDCLLEMDTFLGLLSDDEKEATIWYAETSLLVATNDTHYFIPNITIEVSGYKVIVKYADTQVELPSSSLIGNFQYGDEKDTAADDDEYFVF